MKAYLTKEKKYVSFKICITTLLLIFLFIVIYKVYSINTNTNNISVLSKAIDNNSIVDNNAINEQSNIISQELQSSNTESEPIEVVQALSTDELNYYSSLSYEEKLNFLYNSDYNLEDRIRVFLGDDINNIGIVYYDLSSNEYMEINEDKEFIAASTYKVGLNLLYYHLSSTGEINLNDYIAYDYNDYEEGTGVLQTLDYIDSYTIQDLLDLSLIYSDNIATNMLGRYLGGHESVRAQIYDLLNINFDSSENIITPKIEFEILKTIYDNKDSSCFSHMLEALTNTEFNDRLDKYLPTDIVAHKVGTFDSYIHDVGIIFDYNPYILSFYTNDLYNAEEVIATISNAIYESR